MAAMYLHPRTVRESQQIVNTPNNFLKTNFWKDISEICGYFKADWVPYVEMEELTVWPILEPATRGEPDVLTWLQLVTFPPNLNHC